MNLWIVVYEDGGNQTIQPFFQEVAPTEEEAAEKMGVDPDIESYSFNQSLNIYGPWEAPDPHISTTTSAKKLSEWITILNFATSLKTVAAAGSYVCKNKKALQELVLWLIRLPDTNELIDDTEETSDK